MVTTIEVRETILNAINAAAAKDGNTAQDIATLAGALACIAHMQESKGVQYEDVPVRAAIP